MTQKELKRRLEKWLKKNNLGNIKIKFDEDFSSDCEGKITIQKRFKHDDELKKLYRKFGCPKYDDKALSFLHEIGHIKVQKRISFLEDKREEIIRTLLEPLISIPIGPLNDLGCFIYYKTLRSEIMATKWGANWAKRNLESYKELVKIFSKWRYIGQE